MPQLTNLDFEVLPSPVQSENDKKKYRVIRLKNGLTACLISDNQPFNDNEDENDIDSGESENSESLSEESEDEDSSDEEKVHKDGHLQKMSAAALCVNVGSFSDPKNVPGMAHFLEHMVFMGSEKFPEENDFDSFITKRGGSDNASTDCESTTFYFDCLKKDFFTALDKFAQFFISPLMKRSSIKREREAIESEFQMALPSDSYRKEQLIASFARSDIPVNTFTWGNLITLRDSISEDELYRSLHEFRKRHYSAHRMTLAVQSPATLDELQSYVLTCFSNVPSNNLPPDDFKQYTNVFDTPQFTKMYYVQPVNELIQLDLTWALPSLLGKYKSKPHQYVAWIIGHEGKGSLLSYLKKKVWGLSVSAGNDEAGSEHSSMYCIFSIVIVLTKEGFNHLNELIEVVFSYINLLRKLGPQERLYNEIKIVSDTSFKFASEETAAEVVEDLCENMQLYPSEDYLTGSELYYEYDPEGIKMVLNSLVPNRMNIMVFCNNLPTGLTFDKSEKWFGTKYCEQDIPQAWLKKWKKATPLKEFALPPKNEFLTEDFTLLDEDENTSEYPEKILKTDIVEVWYRKDQKFKLPVAYYNFYFITTLILESSKAAALVDFCLTLISISLTEEAYPANVAGLSYILKNYDKGIALSVSGYNEKLHVLIELITKHFLNFKSHLSQEMFLAVKDKLTKSYHNRLLKPNILAKDVRLKLIINKFHSLIDKYNSIHSLTLQDVITFSDQFFSNLYIKVLIQGNVTSEHGINVVNNLVTTLKCTPIDPAAYPNFRVCQIPKGEHLCVMESFNTNDSNSIITNYYQSGPFSLKDSVIIEMIMLLIEEPLFDTLRTKEQLGYDVSCSNRDTFGILGFSITVNAQATKNSTSYVDQRIEVFVNQASHMLATLTDETFEETKKDLIKTKRCEDVDLKEEVQRNWSEIIEEDYMFDRLTQEISEIEKVTLHDIRKWWELHTSRGNEDNFRKLSIQVAGFKNENLQLEKVTSLKDSTNQSSHVTLNFITCENGEGENETRRQCFIENLNEFKQKLYLYPVVSKSTI